MYTECDYFIHETLHRINLIWTFHYRIFLNDLVFDIFKILLVHRKHVILARILILKRNLYF